MCFEEEGSLEPSPLFGTPFREWQKRASSVPPLLPSDGELRQLSSSSVPSFSPTRAVPSYSSPRRPWAPSSSGQSRRTKMPPISSPLTPQLSGFTDDEGPGPYLNSLSLESSLAAAEADDVAPRSIAPSVIVNEYIKACVQLRVQPLWTVVKVVLPQRKPVLSLELQHVNDKAAMALGVVLAKNGWIKHVNLSKNSIGDEGVTVLLKGIEQSELLNGNEFVPAEEEEEEGEGDEGSDDGEQQLTESLRQRQSRGRRGSSRRSASHDSIRSRSRRNRQLRVTSLGGCIVESLDLSENRITHKGAASLANLLDLEGKELTERPLFALRLKTLNLSGNRIGDKGATSLSAVLIGNRALRKLSLSNAAVGLQGCQALGDLLVATEVLTELDLSWNRISREGVSRKTQRPSLSTFFLFLPDLFFLFLVLFSNILLLFLMYYFLVLFICCSFVWGVFRRYSSSNGSCFCFVCFLYTWSVLLLLRPPSVKGLLFCICIMNLFLILLVSPLPLFFFPFLSPFFYFCPVPVPRPLSLSLFYFFVLSGRVVLPGLEDESLSPSSQFELERSWRRRRSCDGKLFDGKREEERERERKGEGEREIGRNISLFCCIVDFKASNSYSYCCLFTFFSFLSLFELFSSGWFSLSLFSFFFPFSFFFCFFLFFLFFLFFPSIFLFLKYIAEGTDRAGSLEQSPRFHRRRLSREGLLSAFVASLPPENKGQ